MEHFLLNPIKILLLALILVDYLWSFVTYALSDRQLKKPLPDTVRDVYDETAYRKWLTYRRECRRFSLVCNAVLTVLTILLFWCDAFAVVSEWIGVGGLGGEVLLMVCYTLFTTVVSIPFDYYSTFVIEEKHGFNKSTKKTFWLDELKNALLETGLMCGLLAAVSGLLTVMGKWLIVGVFALLAVSMLVMSMFSLQFQKLFNRFDPLPEGLLRDKLNRLFTSNGCAVKSIYVMNASKRTTRANAFCTGLGKQKKIALYDNLVNNYTEDEITAVFAHELGHDKHKDTLMLTLCQMVLYAVLAAGIGLLVLTDTFSVGMGFASVNVAAMMIALFSVLAEPVLMLLQIPMNLISRRMERGADTFAARNALGEPLISALKRLSRDNFSNLNPHPFLSYIGDSHPPVAERIRVIRAAEEKYADEIAKRASAEAAADAAFAAQNAPEQAAE